jgi:YedE family putative selenium metabolism protein
LIGVLVAVVVGNLLLGKFRIGFHGMPLSHTNYAWSYAAMVLCGLAFAAAGGCPLRQLVRSAEGDGDAASFCIGMLVGAGIGHNWTLTSAPDRVVNGVLTVGGPTLPAMIAVAVGIVFCVLAGLAARDLS